MIEQFKHLTIPIDSATFDRLGLLLNEAVRPPWSYIGQRSLDFSPGARSISFAYRGHKWPNANLSIAWYENRASIGNIVPVEYGQFSMSQYNCILDDFCILYLNSIARLLHLNLSVTSDRRDISDWLGEVAKRKLEIFSLVANKGSGATHPNDRRRWLEFIIAAHKQGSDLPTEVLRTWLIDELNWPATIAQNLSAEYENSLELLQQYDGSR